MSSPHNVVFVRHGESEANIIQAAEKKKRVHELSAAVRARPDWMHRLTRNGVWQATVAGEWLDKHIGPVPEVFDARYCSSFLRARETAAYLGGMACKWRPHNMLHERDWGEFGTTPRHLQAESYPHAAWMRAEAPLYARLNGGEAIADSVALRVRDFRATLKRKWADKNVLAVTHGDVIGTVRYVFEEMLPEQWHEADRDKAQRIGNCAILWYTDTNPEDASDVRPYLKWRRMIQPDNLEKSPFGGQWQEMSDNRFMSGMQLLESVEAVPRLLPGAK